MVCYGVGIDTSHEGEIGAGSIVNDRCKLVLEDTNGRSGGFDFDTYTLVPLPTGFRMVSGRRRALETSQKRNREPKVLCCSVGFFVHFCVVHSKLGVFAPTHFPIQQRSESALPSPAAIQAVLRSVAATCVAKIKC